MKPEGVERQQDESQPVINHVTLGYEIIIRSGACRRLFNTRSTRLGRFLSLSIGISESHDGNKLIFSLLF
jgi:hypothetical protein